MFFCFFVWCDDTSKEIEHENDDDDDDDDDDTEQRIGQRLFSGKTCGPRVNRHGNVAGIFGSWMTWMGSSGQVYSRNSLGIFGDNYTLFDFFGAPICFWIFVGTALVSIFWKFG